MAPMTHSAEWWVLVVIGAIWLAIGLTIACFYLGWLMRGLVLDVWDTVLLALRLKVRRSVGRPVWRRWRG